MKDDINFSGEKLLKKKVSKARVAAARKNAHFAVLVFTSGTGAPVMCEIIFASQDLTP